jgi:SAM-dependent methyltransferase
VWETYHTDGSQAALRRVFGGVAMRLRPYRRRFHEYLTDRYFGIDTAGIDKTHESDEFGVFAYEASASRHFKQAMRSLGIDYSKFTLVDFGCGKGAALIFASELGFRRILGVEVVSEFLDSAAKNIARVERRKPGLAGHIELVLGDAVAFPLPDEPLVLYFFNPFSAETMGSVISRAVNSLEERPRAMFIVYLNARFAEVVEESAGCSVIERRSKWATFTLT